jgi:hypothetical protein
VADIFRRARPSAQILCGGYAQDLADKLALDCRDIMITNAQFLGDVQVDRLH